MFSSLQSDLLWLPGWGKMLVVIDSLPAYFLIVDFDNKEKQLRREPGV